MNRKKSMKLMIISQKGEKLLKTSKPIINLGKDLKEIEVNFDIIKIIEIIEIKIKNIIIEKRYGLIYCYLYIN